MATKRKAGWVKTSVPGIRRWGNEDKFQIRISTGRQPDGTYGRIEETKYCTWDQAKKKHAELLLAIAEGRRKPSQDLTFAQVLDDWLEVREGQVEDTSYDRDEIEVRLRLKPFLGTRRVTSLEADDFTRLYARLRKPPHNLSPSSIRKTHQTAVNALESVRKLVGPNVAREAVLPKLVKPEVTPPTPDDGQRILDEGWRRNRARAACLSTCLATGSRRGEGVALKWKDIVLGDAGGLITFRRVLVHKKGAHYPGLPKGVKVKESTKTDKIRTVSIGPDVVKMLFQHRREAEAAAAKAGATLTDDSWVFAERAGSTMPFAPDSMSKWFLRMCEYAGVTGVSWKDGTRHLSSTQLVGKGIDLVTVSGRNGHSRVSTTSDIYSHFLPPNDVAAAELLEGVFRFGPAPEATDA